MALLQAVEGLLQTVEVAEDVEVVGGFGFKWFGHHIGHGRERGLVQAHRSLSDLSPTDLAGVWSVSFFAATGDLELSRCLRFALNACELMPVRAALFRGAMRTACCAYAMPHRRGVFAERP